MENTVRIEKQFLQGGSKLELFTFPIGIIFFIIVFIISVQNNDIDYLSLAIVVFLVIDVAFEIPKTPHVAIKMDDKSITEWKGSKRREIHFDDTVIASIDKKRLKADPQRHTITGITLSNGKVIIDCLLMDGWTPQDIQEIWDQVLVVVEERGVKMSKSMESYYYSMSNLDN